MKNKKYDGNFIFFLIWLFIKGTISFNNNSLASESLQIDSNKNLADMKPAILKTAVKLNLKQSILMNQILEFYTLKDATNDLCRNHSIIYTTSLRNFEPWALKMFDSSSKIQSGILYGNLFEFGNFKQCVSISANSLYGPIRGKHCTLKIHPTEILLKKILTFRDISEKRWDRVKIFVEGASLDWSICIPDSCMVDDVLSHFDKLFQTLAEGLNLSVSLVNANCLLNTDTRNFTNVELAVLFATIFYIMVIAVLSLADYFKVMENSLISIFSVQRNTVKIFSKSPQDSDLDCVHGIRFLSTCYVIIGHRYLMMMFFPVINRLQIMEWILYYRSTAITGGTLCVDTFFMISGMLVSLGISQETTKRKINWSMFYFHRFIRITCPLAVVVLWYCIFMHHLGSGPLWNDMLENVQKPCIEYWWATLLHIQNYVHPYPLCLTQTWYLTCDMQYYFFSPILLIPFQRNERIGWLNCIFFYILSVLISFRLAWLNQYNGGVPVTNQLFATNYFQHYYIAPHARASTYIIGIGFGIIVNKYKEKHFKIGFSFAIIGWIISITAMFISLVGCHIFFLEDHNYNRWESSIFLAISRSTWTLGILWMVWACINGYGGPINYFLSLHIFRVFGRISYGMYLLHMGVQYMMSGAAKMPGYFSDFTSIFAALGDLLLMIVAGFIFTILFEAPVIQILSLLTKRRKSKSNSIHEVKVQPFK